MRHHHKIAIILYVYFKFQKKSGEPGELEMRSEEKDVEGDGMQE